MNRRRHIIVVFCSLFVFFGVLSSSLPAYAADAKKTSDSKSATETTTSGGGGVQSYGADTPLQDGTIVQLKGKGTTTVEVSKQSDLGHMYGVTVDRNKLQLTFSGGGLKNEVYVATAGTYDVLVSSQGGDIKAGDYVTLSAVNGVAMKADSEPKAVFGRAAANFNSKSDSIGKVALKDTAGKAAKQVTLGIIPVAIDVKSNPIQPSTKTNIPKFLQRIGEAIAEKPVGPLRMYLSIAITGISIMAAVVILYSGIRSSLISIGRNPLSKKSIFRALLEIILTAVLILIIGLFAVYLLLKL